MKEIVEVEYSNEEKELKIIITRLMKKIINIKAYIIIIIITLKVKLKIDKRSDNEINVRSFAI